MKDYLGWQAARAVTPPSARPGLRVRHLPRFANLTPPDPEPSPSPLAPASPSAPTARASAAEIAPHKAPVEPDSVQQRGAPPAPSPAAHTAMTETADRLDPRPPAAVGLTVTALRAAIPGAAADRAPEEPMASRPARAPTSEPDAPPPFDTKPDDAALQARPRTAVLAAPAERARAVARAADTALPEAPVARPPRRLRAERGQAVDAAKAVPTAEGIVPLAPRATPIAALAPIALASARHARQHPAPREAAPPPAPAVNIVIHRIEVRAPAEARTAPRRAENARARPTLSLDAYLKGRSPR